MFRRLRIILPAVSAKGTELAGPQHIVSAFGEELEQLSAELLRMGGLAEAMIRDASRAVVTRDAALAETVIERGKKVCRRLG